MIALLYWLACLTLTVPPTQVSRVVDGDTFILYSVGVPAEERIRLLGVDTPELHDTSAVVRAKALQAGRYTAEWLSRAPFSLESCKRDSFGRLLAVVTRGADTLAVDLVRAGLGVPR